MRGIHALAISRETGISVALLIRGEIVDSGYQQDPVGRSDASSSGAVLGESARKARRDGAGASRVNHGNRGVGDHILSSHDPSRRR